MKKLAIVLWLTQQLAAIAMLAIAVAEIESIIVTGPILALIGLLLAVVALPLKSWVILVFAISAPLVTASIALMIAAFELGPDDARGPTTVTLASYLALASPLTILSWFRICGWDVPATCRGNPTVRFSMKTLLLIMTGTAILIGTGNLLFRNASLDETLLFGGYALVVMSLCALIVWRFVATRTPTAAEAH